MSVLWGGWRGAGMARSGGGLRSIQGLEQLGLWGFTPEQAPDNRGLRNMRDRIEAVGGTLTIHTLTIDARAHGTSIRAVIPTTAIPAG